MLYVVAIVIVLPAVVVSGTWCICFGIMRGYTVAMHLESGTAVCLFYSH